MKRTKIIATIGPASSSDAMLRKLLKAGVDVVRLNLSHGDFAQHKAVVSKVRRLARAAGRPIGILADLPGPKIRTGRLQNGRTVTLRTGEEVTLTTRQVLGTERLLSITYPRLPRFVKPGDKIFLNDGLIQLEALHRSRASVVCRISVGGVLGERKGMNLPGLSLPLPALTTKDREGIAFAVRAGVDFIAVSFVRAAEDLRRVRRLIRSHRGEIPVIAKIEKPEALRHIEAIAKEADGFLIARGDLGVEVPAEEVPVVQKDLIRSAAAASIPVITATQMLDSMIHNPVPTRAETTDVANAIWDGSDALLLSGETAAGAYPLESVQTMVRIIGQAESHPLYQRAAPAPPSSHDDTQAVLLAAAAACRTGLYKAIITYTKTGRTASALSRQRPPVPIFALTPEEATYRRLSLVWGVAPLLSHQGHTVDEMIRSGDRVLMKNTGLKKGDRVILVAGTRLTSGATNLMKIHRIGDTLAGGS